MNLDHFRAVTASRQWGSYAQLLLSHSNYTEACRELFGTYWTEAGHHVREQMADDRALVRLLRHMLPSFSGSATILYRGENLQRWNDHKVGLAWSSSIDVARMFAGGLNAVVSGGILLSAHFAPTAIVSGPNDHSRYLGEGQYTIDPFCDTKIKELETFPPMP